MSFLNRHFFLVLLIVSLTVRIECNDNELLEREIKESFDKFKDQIPGGVAIPDALKNVNIDNIKTKIKDKCSQVSGGDEAYAKIEIGAEELQNCTQNLINVELLQQEIEEAQPKGELDTVFNKYCRKRNIAIECMENFTSLLEPCLQPKEIDGKRTFVKIFKNLLNFICYKDGDQIALFIAEKGPECFDQRKDELVTCMNSTFSDYLPSEKDNVNINLNLTTLPTELPQLVMGKEQCNDMDILQICVVKSLEKCEESTPANLVESMFKFVRNETPCGNLTIKAKSSAFINAVSSTLIGLLITFISIRSIVL